MARRWTDRQGGPDEPGCDTEKMKPLRLRHRGAPGGLRLQPYQKFICWMHPRKARRASLRSKLWRCARLRLGD